MTYTKTMSDNLTKAFDHFNKDLFDGRLPDCVIVLHRKRGALGYFWAEQWRERGKKDSKGIHEIALNPSEFNGYTEQDILSTLVHEMCHMEQHVFGKPSRNGYHNGEWAKMMERVGLIPSATAAPGGKRTGQRVSHYIEAGGRFEKSCALLMKRKGFMLALEAVRTCGGKKKKKSANKVAYQCEECGAKAWGKDNLNLVCGDCDVVMEAA